MSTEPNPSSKKPHKTETASSNKIVNLVVINSKKRTSKLFSITSKQIKRCYPFPILHVQENGTRGIAWSSPSTGSDNEYEKHDGNGAQKYESRCLDSLNRSGKLASETTPHQHFQY